MRLNWWVSIALKKTTILATNSIQLNPQQCSNDYNS